MKRHQTAAAFFIAGFLTAAGGNNVVAQNAHMVNTRDADTEWRCLDLMSRGENMPTTIQSLSAKEASLYGLAKPDGDGATGPFVRFAASAQPYILGWNGLDVSNRSGDTSLRERLSLKNPVLLAGIDFGSNGFFTTMRIDMGTDSLAQYAGTTGISGLWARSHYLDYWTFPEEGYAAWAGDNFTVAAGRFRTGIGLGSANIFLNGDAQWYDQVQLSWWTKKFRYFAFWGTSSSYLSEAEYDVQTGTTNNSTTINWDALNNHDASTRSLVPLKLFTYHRIEFRPLDKIGFGLAEMQLVGGKSPELLNLMPTVYWHNAYSAGVSNVMAQADLWCVPFKNILLWGEFVMDDSKAPSEKGASKPNCWAWELGTKWALPVTSRGWRYSLAAEYSHADKWTYARWQPYLTMYQRQLLTGGKRHYDTPLGHPEGGDVDQGKISFTALERRGKRIEASYTLTCKGPVYLGMIEYITYDGKERYVPVYYDYDTYAGTGALDALLGSIRKYTHAVNVKIDWPLSRRLEANGEVDFAYILNARHIAGKTATETVYKAGLRWKFGKELE